VLNYCQENWFVKSCVVLFLLVATGLPFFRHCWGGGTVTIWNEYTHTHTHKHNCTLLSMRTDQNKPHTRLADRRDYFSTANFETKITATFRGTFGIFADFENFHLFIPRFLVEPQTMSCGALAGEHRKVIRKQIMHTWYALKTQHKYIYASIHTHTNENTRMHV